MRYSQNITPVMLSHNFPPQFSRVRELESSAVITLTTISPPPPGRTPANNSMFCVSRHEEKLPGFSTHIPTIILPQFVIARRSPPRHRRESRSRHGLPHACRAEGAYPYPVILRRLGGRCRDGCGVCARNPTGIGVAMPSGARRCVSYRKSRYAIWGSCARGMEPPHRGDISSSSRPSFRDARGSREAARAAAGFPVRGTVPFGTVISLALSLSFGLHSPHTFVCHRGFPRERETRKIRENAAEIESVDPLRALIRKCSKFGERGGEEPVAPASKGTFVRTLDVNDALSNA